MARFGRRFEVKREMRDVKEIKKNDERKNIENPVERFQEELKKEVNSVGFDDDFDEEYNQEHLQKCKMLNAQVEAELEQYYDDSITEPELQAYLVSKVNEIYGKELQRCNILIEPFVDEFLNLNEFNGAESYRKLTQTIEESIMDINKNMRRNEEKKEGNVAEGLNKSKLEMLDEEERKGIISGYKNMSAQGEISANAYLASQAKKLGVDKSELTAFVLQSGRAEIDSPDKVLHYHRTSLQSFEKIVQTGYLLNRKNMQMNGIDVSNLNGSSSANIQFSRDVYDKEGNMQMSGFDTGENLGASSSDVVFVMSPELMKEETYNCLSKYPTAQKVDIQRCCAAILAKNPDIQMQVESELKAKNMSIKIILQENFDRSAVLDELYKESSDREHGVLLKSVNGKDILSSAIKATEGVVRTDEITKQSRTVKEIQAKQNEDKSVETI